MPILVVLVLIIAWIVVINLAGISGLLAGTSFSSLVVAGMVFSAFLVIPMLASSYRKQINQIPMRFLILLNLSRVAGISYLILFQRGYFPYTFAIPAGMADISAAVAASAAAMCIPMNSVTKWAFVLLWNTLGLVGQVLVISIGIKMANIDMSSMEGFSHWPLILLPLFVYPLVFSVHIMIYYRLLGSRLKPG